MPGSGEVVAAAALEDGPCSVTVTLQAPRGSTAGGGGGTGGAGALLPGGTSPLSVPGGLLNPARQLSQGRAFQGRAHSQASPSSLGRSQPPSHSPRSHAQQQRQLLTGLQTSAWSTLLRSPQARQAPLRRPLPRGYSTSTLQFGQARSSSGSLAVSGCGDGGVGMVGCGGSGPGLRSNGDVHPPAGLLQTQTARRPNTRASVAGVLLVAGHDSDSGAALSLLPHAVVTRVGGSSIGGWGFQATGSHPSTQHTVPFDSGVLHPPDQPEPRQSGAGTGSGSVLLGGFTSPPSMARAVDSAAATGDTSASSLPRTGPGPLGSVGALGGGGGAAGAAGGGGLSSTPGGSGAMTRLLGITLATVASRRMPSATPRHTEAPAAWPSPRSPPQWARHSMPATAGDMALTSGPLEDEVLLQSLPRPATANVANVANVASVFHALAGPSGGDLSAAEPGVGAMRLPSTAESAVSLLFSADGPHAVHYSAEAQPPPIGPHFAAVLDSRGTGAGSSFAHPAVDTASGTGLSSSEAHLFMMTTAGVSRSPFSTLGTALLSTHAGMSGAHAHSSTAGGRTPGLGEGEGDGFAEGDGGGILGAAPPAVSRRHGSGTTAAAAGACAFQVLSAPDVMAPVPAPALPAAEVNPTRTASTAVSHGAGGAASPCSVPSSPHAASSPHDGVGSLRGALWDAATASPAAGPVDTAAAAAAAAAEAEAAAAASQSAQSSATLPTARLPDMLMGSMTLNADDGRHRPAWAVMMGSTGPGNDITSPHAHAAAANASMTNALDTATTLPSLALLPRLTATNGRSAGGAASCLAAGAAEGSDGRRRSRQLSDHSTGAASASTTSLGADRGQGGTGVLLRVDLDPAAQAREPRRLQPGSPVLLAPAHQSPAPPTGALPSVPFPSVRSAAGEEMLPQLPLWPPAAPPPPPAPPSLYTSPNAHSPRAGATPRSLVHGPAVTGLLAAAAAARRTPAPDPRGRRFPRPNGSSSGYAPAPAAPTANPVATGATPLSAVASRGGGSAVGFEEVPYEVPYEPLQSEPQWHEVSLTRFVHPVLGQSVVLVVQNDVTARIWAERQLARVVEAEHTLLENIFPHHVIQHIAAAAAASDDEHEEHEEEAGAEGLGQGQGTDAAAVEGAAQGSAADHGPPSARLPAIRGDTFLHLATSHKALTVLFCDIQGFTPMCKAVPPMSVMAFLNDLFTRLDGLLDQYGVYKVETIGDCYVAAGGLMRVDEETGAVTVRSDDVDPQHASRTVQFAKALLRAASAVRLPTTGEPVRLRVGIHSGPAMSGVVGTRMPRFCLFGDTMNTASRMESTGEAGAIHVSQATRDLAPGEAWQPTGGVEVKVKGVMSTFLLRP
ncbi:hypothetical protein HYH03_003795 [Edaphochlamys debaryana]|uniref:Guanylate cyclase domain-containing protein n=1 Tax=Edaphochlamys debaryana TaxID=47281 RepID=A0A835YI23_9CHLO|nr:hypothetical protein HYH03_003795 [Edaphochlamys debaryana]|eukprot:KAG2498034.1 hypothetical protein HYH03_003795 [Edaphochlamys debaryana]